MAANWFLILVLFLFVYFREYDAAPESALVTHLPGFTGTFPSKHYSGYATRLPYYSTAEVSKGILRRTLLYCGSMVDRAALALMGLFMSMVSNIIYLDSPAGVGLSYSNVSDDYNTGDLKTASDSHIFLLKVETVFEVELEHNQKMKKLLGLISLQWFEQYPEFLTNPFYIAGESYAGVYVPTLSSEVSKGIDAGVKPILNFKGYIVGNGVTDPVFDGNALVPFAHGMGLISDDLFKEVNAACQGSYWNPANESCQNKLDAVDEDIGSLNVYDILEPCYHSPEIRDVVSTNNRLPSSFRKLGETERPLPVRKRMFGRAWPFRAPVREGIVPTWPQLGSSSVPCT
ncbi:hypothetical protein ACLOJK_019709 [Asimina triloba]